MIINMNKKNYHIMLAAGLMTLCVTACTDENGNTATTNNEPGSPITATTTIESMGAGVITRADLPTGITDITMYYPAVEVTGTPLPLTDYQVTDATCSGSTLKFRTGTTADGNEESNLLWQGTLDKGLTKQDFYLTVTKPDDFASTTDGLNIPNLSAAAEKGNVLWAKGTTDGKRSPLAFGKMYSRYARFTLIVKPAGERPDLDVKRLTASINVMPGADASVANSLTTATGIRQQAWPLAADGTLETKKIIDPATFVESSAAPTTFTEDDKTELWIATMAGSVIIVPQTIGESNKILTLTYDRDRDGSINTATGNTAERWEFDLSNVIVNRLTGNPYYYINGKNGEKNTAFGYNAGEHIILTLTLNISDTLEHPINIGISDYEASADLTFDLKAEEEQEKP